MREDEIEYVRVFDEIHREFPKFSLQLKRMSWKMRALDVLLRVLSLGKMTTFLTGTVTTIGSTVYVPKNWAKRSPYSRAILLRHEWVHLRQRQDLTAPLFFLFYYLLPLPIGFAWGRARLEMQAYRETLQAAAEYYGTPIIKGELFREHIVREFTGPKHLWMWPFRAQVERWYDGVVSVIETEVLVRDAHGQKR